jgi:hypothetical protein
VRRRRVYDTRDQLTGWLGAEINVQIANAQKKIADGRPGAPRRLIRCAPILCGPGMVVWTSPTKSASLSRPLFFHSADAATLNEQPCRASTAGYDGDAAE